MEEIEQERTDICAPGVVSELQEVNQPAKEYSDLTVPSVSMEEPQVETEIEEKVASPESSAIQGSSAPCSQNDSDFNRSTDGEDSQKLKRKEDEVGPTTSGRSKKHRGHIEDKEEEPKEADAEAPWLQDENFVMLDMYNSDLNLKIGNNRMQAEPLSQEGFALMWAGVRATFGVNKGRVAFEVKITEHIDVSHITMTEEHFPHLLRIGWSHDSSSFQLGNEKCSYGYDGCGKLIENSRMKDYGKPFSAGDVVTALLDFGERQISFMKNGELQGVAFQLEKLKTQAVSSVDLTPITIEDDDVVPINNGVIPLLNDDVEIISPKTEKPVEIQEPEISILTPASAEVEEPPEDPLFPHIATKNSKFEVNLGQLNEPWFPLPEGYAFINDVPLEQRHRGSVAPENKRDCRIIMMVGLPGCGKTTWVDKFLLEHSTEKWNLLSINSVLDQMKDMGNSRKKNLQGRWDVLMGLSAKCLTKLLTIAYRKKRNYIVDQTNVSVTARKRKLAQFKEFQRKAVVMVPKEEIYAERFRRQEQAEGKQIPPETLLEMKGNFVLPEETDNIFDEIEFVELPRDLASLIVSKYNEEGKVVKPPPEKKGKWQDKKRDSQPSISSAQAPGTHVRAGFPSGNTVVPTPVPTPRAAWGAPRNPAGFQPRNRPWNQPYGGRAGWGQQQVQSGAYRYGGLNNNYSSQQTFGYTRPSQGYAGYGAPAVQQGVMFAGWTPQQQSVVRPQMYGNWVTPAAAAPSLQNIFAGSQWQSLYGTQQPYGGTQPPPT